LRELIETGRYLPGERLPTESALQKLYGVSRITVRTALRRLEEDGLVSSQRGRGTFVHPRAAEATKIERHPARLLAFEDEILRHGSPARVDVLTIERCLAPGRIGVLLEVPASEEVAHVRRLGWVGDIPLWLESRYFHPRIGDALIERGLNDLSMTASLQAIIGVPIVQTRSRISAGPATTYEAQLLAVHSGDPVLINEFASYDSDSRPVAAARAIFRADRYAFVVEVPSLNEKQHGTLQIRSTLVSPPD